MRIETVLAQIGTGRDPATGAISMPIHQSATFEHPALGQSTGFDYSRSLNPTRQALEVALAKLEDADGGFAFSSGMAAITAVLTYFKSGDHFVVTEDAYGGTYRIFDAIFSRFGLSASFVDTTDLEAVKAAITDNTVAIFLESPTNPMLKVADLEGIIQLAKAQGLMTIVDNTFMTPIYQKPLVLGADIVLHSGSKYLSGHNDVISGAVMTKGQGLTVAMAYIQKSTGAILGPQDSWLMMRGLKTLSLRMHHQCASAYRIAQWLAAHPQVKAVHYPGLALKAPFGAMIAFSLESPEACASVLSRLEIIRFAESLGGTESLITYPCTQTHAEMPVDYRNRLGITDKLLRFSVGIEHHEDLIADLEQALATTAAVEASVDAAAGEPVQASNPGPADYDYYNRSGHHATKWCEMGQNFGEDNLLPLWVADMDFQVAPSIQKAIGEMADHAIFGYMHRGPSYFEAIIRWYLRRHQWQLQPEWLVFTPGVICAMSLLLQSLSKPSDKILIQEPVYHPFKQKILELDRTPLIHSLSCDDLGRYHMDFKVLEDLFVAHRPRVMLLSNPHNPVGRVWPREDLERLGNLCMAYGVRIIADEIHCDLVQKPYRHTPMASLSPAIADITVTLAAPTKTFNIAGLHSAFAICTNPADKAIIDTGLQQLDLKRNNSFSLVATEAAFSGGEPWLEDLLVTLKANADYVNDYLQAELPLIRVSPLEGTYLMWLKVDAYIGDEVQLQEHLVAAGLAVNRGAMFGDGGQGHIRLNIACPRPLLEAAMTRLKAALLG